MIKKIIFIIITLFSICSCATLSESGRIYERALSNIKLNNLDGAFFDLRELARDYPNSPYSKKVRFAIAEYYFLKNDYYDSIEEFSLFLGDFPNSPEALFAKAILYKIISEINDQNLMELSSKIRKQFFSKPIILIFSEYKTKSFNTLLGSRYAIKDYVDRVEIFKDNELFLKIEP